MKWEEVITKFGHQSVLDTQMLLIEGENPTAVRVQISRWVKAGKLIQLRRGIYILAEPYRKASIPTSHLASFLYRPSYISREHGLAYYGLIPEGVPDITSVTTRRSAKFSTPLGEFTYRHIKKELFWGYQEVDFDNQTAFYALPEKALLDTFYLRSGPINRLFLEGLRLQHVETLELRQLDEFANRFGSPRIKKAAAAVRDYAEEMKREFKEL